MVAIKVREGAANLDLANLYKYLSAKLPKYAVPLFIRFVPNMNLTGTFKHQKTEFRSQGIELDKIPKDHQPIYWLRNKTYVPFTADDYTAIQNVQIKL